MTFAERLRVALRYTIPTGRAHLSTFLSTLSILGLILAIALLIIVLSVMNGFDKEMRERILGLVPHIVVYGTAAKEDASSTMRRLTAHPEVVEVTPFVEFDALVIRGSRIETAAGIGLDVAGDAVPLQLLAYLEGGRAGAQAFRSDEQGLALGADLAARLGVQEGDRLTLVVPGAGSSLRPEAAQFQAVTLRAVLETGTELDQSLAIVPLPLASRLAGLGGAVGAFRVSTTDLFEVQRIAWELVDLLPPGYYATNWKMTHGNLYSAIQLSRNLVTLLLVSIIAVAAFNVVSSLVLVVLDKRGDIAILRTLGASGGDIAWIFLLQGALIGLIGVVLGSLAGVLGSLAVPGAVSWLEGVMDIRFLDTDVYPVSFVPVDLLPRDVLLVGSVALLMCLVAAIYPARRAATLAPAQVLNQDR